jgi:hypothetical protein
MQKLRLSLLHNHSVIIYLMKFYADLHPLYGRRPYSPVGHYTLRVKNDDDLKKKKPETSTRRGRSLLQGS